MKTLWMQMMALLLVAGSLADLSQVSQVVLDDSEEPYSRRIYSYDLQAGANGAMHVIYAKPVPGQERCEITYAWRTGGQWQKLLIDGSGKVGSISTHLRLHEASGTLHICYIKDQQDPQTRLVYRTLKAGVLSPETVVGPGGWHTRMDLDAAGRAVFVRQDVHDLRLLSPTGATSWEPRTISLPAAEYYSIGNLVYDRTRNVYHITYGDAYTNKRFWHARSGDGRSWTASLIDPEPRLYELEFWTSLALNSQGRPYTAYYRYAPNNYGTSLLFGEYVNGAWQTRTAAGNSSYWSRSGMGIGMALDSMDGVYCAYDNSTDMPRDSEGERGTIVHAYSRNGRNWEYYQQLTRTSAEGYCRVAIRDRKFYLLGLADFVDAKLYFTEYDIVWKQRAYIPLALPDRWFALALLDTTTSQWVKYEVRFGPSHAVLSDLQLNRWYWFAIYDFAAQQYTHGQWVIITP